MNRELEERLHDLNYVLSNEEIEELRNICYEISNSWCPLSDFFNDIELNKSETYNKNQAYKDLWLIVLIILDRKDENKSLETIKKKKVNLEFLKCSDNYEQYCLICSYGNEISKEEFDLLKKTLLEEDKPIASKGLEFIERELKYYEEHVGWYDDGHKISQREVDEYENVYKELKALEIIKNALKEFYGKDFEEYLKHLYKKMELTEEEYDLLKEVLL